MSVLVVRNRIKVSGVVQGVGFRPLVYRLAVTNKLTGFVQNQSGCVLIEIQGHRDAVADFPQLLQEHLPSAAHISKSTIDEVSAVAGEHQFEIRNSVSCGAVDLPVPPDLAVCEQCLAEMWSTANRRFRYPFINCTQCGPRFSILKELPYDRSRTTMSAFTMCDTCQAEYQNPDDRRYHAEPNACADCGPALWFTWNHSAVATMPTNAQFSGDQRLQHEDAIQQFHKSIAQGAIVAVKGIGGFHLACSATDEEAVMRLRKRKKRGNKPFAVMVADDSCVEAVAEVGASQASLLHDASRPIVLLHKSADFPLCQSVAPGLRKIGIMLPDSPLHYLLTERGPLVMTSGNIAEEPIARTNQEAVAKLSTVADAFLFHNRDIHHVCDDSVVQPHQHAAIPIRCSRGYVPQIIESSRQLPNSLAVGGELKSAICITSGSRFYMSQHIGDMGNIDTLTAMERCVRLLTAVLKITPDLIVCDQHPDFLSTRWAEQQAQLQSIPVVRIQHHRAHAASLLAEHSRPPNSPVISVVYDGTGLGDDGCIWGGEILATANGLSTEASGSLLHRRKAHLAYQPLPGGDSVIKEPAKAALAWLHASGLPWSDMLPCVNAYPVQRRELLKKQLESGLNCVNTSSMGRLFDVVSSIIGICHSTTYEAQAAIEMEAVCTEIKLQDGYEFNLTGNDILQVNPQNVLAAVCKDVLNGTDEGLVVSRFYAAVVNVTVQTCERIRCSENINTVGLTGGVFQNAMLLDAMIEGLSASGFEVLTHRCVPPNDGGLALGQAALAGLEYDLRQAEL